MPTIGFTFLVTLFFTNNSNAIIRRHDVDDVHYVVLAEDHPAIVDLLEKGDCLATLIHEKWFITAAHCAKHMKREHTISVGGETQEVTNVYIHEDYGFWNDVADIALIQMEKRIQNVEPIDWYTESNERDMTVVFVGRGDTATGITGQSDAVLDGKTRIATNTIVKTTKREIEFVFNAPEDGAVTDLEGISGDGDSGGPALYWTGSSYKIVGLSSYQEKRGNKLGTYGVHEFYVRVSSYDAWIQSHLSGTYVDTKGCSVLGDIDNQFIWFGSLTFLCVVRRTQKNNT
jgi:secreted trypsin-like serine protease